MPDEKREFALVCPRCGEENPPEFPTCWKCHADLPESPAKAEEAPPAAPSEIPGPPSALPARRKRIAFEVALALFVIWVPWVAGGIWDSIALRPPRSSAIALWSLVQGTGTLALLAYFAWLDGDGRRLLGIPRPQVAKELAWAAAVFVAAIVANSLAYRITLALGLDHERGPLRSFAPDASWLRPFSFALFALIEEVFYRAYLWRRLTELLGRPTLSFVIASLLFTAAHVYPPAASVSILFFGLTLALFFRARPSVWPLVLAHWAYNQFVAI